MGQRLLFLIAVTFLQVFFASSRVYAQDAEVTLGLIANTADRICGVTKDTGSVSSAAAKGVVKVELQGLASQLGSAGVQGGGGVATEAYQGVVREQLATFLRTNADCKLRVFEILQSTLLPRYQFPSVIQSNALRNPQTDARNPQTDARNPQTDGRNPQIVRTGLPCQKEQLTNWLDQHGIYGNRPFDISIYDNDGVNWIVNGEPSRKTRSDIAKEEDIFRRVYPMQRYTPVASSAGMIGGQCVLKQEVEGYKKSSTGKVEFNNFKFEFGIRSDANGTRIVERKTDVLSSRR
jgi:hypothetical protein